jgi:hypothetical protein
MVEEYSACQEVRDAHAIPRFDYRTAGEADINSWNFTDINSMTSDAGGDYVIGVVTVPAALIGIGVFSVIAMNILICCRCFCKCLRCKPEEEDIDEDPDKVIKERHRVMFYLGFFMFICFCADHLIYYANTDIGLGIDDAVEGSNGLKDIFSELSQSLTEINANITNIEAQNTASSSSGCFSGSDSSVSTASSTLSDGLTSLKAAVSTLSNLVDPVPEALDDVIDYLDVFFREAKLYALFVGYAIVVLTLMLFAAGIYLQSKFILYLTMTWTEVLVLILTVLCGFMMILITFYADFCMEPSDNIAGLAPSNSLKKQISYFSTCVGESPFEDGFTGASDSIGTMTTALDDVYTSCAAYSYANGNVYLSELPNWLVSSNESQAIQDSITKMNSTISCIEINGIYANFIYDAICTNIFRGFYRFWIIEYVVSGTLFFTIIMTSVAWQYFGAAWKLKSGTVHKEDADIHEHMVTHDDAEIEMASAEYSFTPASPQPGKGRLQRLNKEEHDLI